MRNLAREARYRFPYSNVTPPWLLYFLRCLRATGGNYRAAWAMLPRRLPATIPCPSVVECAAVLAHHRLA